MSNALIPIRQELIRFVCLLPSLNIPTFSFVSLKSVSKSKVMRLDSKTKVQN